MLYIRKHLSTIILSVLLLIVSVVSLFIGVLDLDLTGLLSGDGVLSAIFAALTSVLAKIGISGVESNLGTAIRTAVVLIMAWVIVFAKGEHKGLKQLDKKELLFITLSGLATGGSWLCYYYAVQNGVLSVVAPIDKMSILVTVIFSVVFFKERLSKKSAVGLCLMCIGTLAMVIWA